MNESDSTVSPDPYCMSVKQKRDFFEKSCFQDCNNQFNKIKKSTSLTNLPSCVSNKKKFESLTFNKNVSTIASNQAPSPVQRQQIENSDLYNIPSQSSSTCYSVSQIVNGFNISSNESKKSFRAKSVKPLKASEALSSPMSLSMREFHDVFRDLDTFIGKELNEIECRRRLGILQKGSILKEIKQDQNSIIDEEIKSTLKKLKDDVNEIRENQKGFEEKMRKHELNQINLRKKNDFDMNKNNKELAKTEEKSLKNTLTLEKAVQHTPEIDIITPASSLKTDISEQSANMSEIKHPTSIASTDSSIITESGFSRAQRIEKLQAEIYKEETLLSKINRVLESIKQIDERNLPDIINIERHYLVASTRFQAALSELQKLNEHCEKIHLPPFNRKGKLYVRDIMLEVKSSYFQRTEPSINEFLVAVMKYEDKIYATKPVRIDNDIRILKFTEKFSIPEIYIDFEMRLEIYGTTFWRKNNSVRDTMLKKYGFITFSLADTGNKPKRFSMIETLQSDNVPIRSKIMMKISQKITTDIKYKGILYIKLNGAWHETNARLNGHLLEFAFAKKHLGIDFIRSQETMLLDLYNADCDTVIHVDPHRVAEKSFSFLIKFNHYVDFTNFYIIVAADNEEHFIEWISAINRVLALIK